VPGGPRPDFAIYLLGKSPPPVQWDARWVLWPDFRLPTDLRDAQDALREAWHRARGRASRDRVRGRPRKNRHRPRLYRRAGRRSVCWRWRSCDGTTTNARWRRSGSGATSGTTSGP